MASKTGNRRGWEVAEFVAVALFAAALFLAIHYQFDFSLEDEGFLWHGAQQVLDGASPVRDFRAYEPARYYWTAGIYKAISNSSNSSTRLACALFGGTAYAGSLIYVFSREKSQGGSRAAGLALGVVALTVWTFPYYRVFDTSAAALTFAACYYLYANKSTKSLVICGIFCGALFTIGRNHSLYALISLATCIVTDSIEGRSEAKKTLERILILTSSLAATTATLYFLQELARPGTIWKSVNSWLELIKLGKTNLDAEWPWAQANMGMPLSQLEGHLAVGITVLVIFGVSIGGTVFAISRSIQGKNTSKLAAATCATTLGFLHCAISRPDLIHIATPLIPVIIGAVTWASRNKSRCSILAIAIIAYITARSALREQVAYQCLTKPKGCIQISISAEENRFTKREPGVLYQYLAEALRDKRFLAIPSFSTLYAVKGQLAPSWAFYEVWPADKSTQEERIKEIKRMKPEVIIVKSTGQSTDPETTMPLVMEHIRLNYKLKESRKDMGIILFSQEKEPKPTRELGH